jgi:thiol-disulfide isomerase/thioredoxin
VSFFARLGLAVVRPRQAFALAADRDHAGRAGSDLLALILMVLIATQLRGIVGAIWLGSTVQGSLGMQAFVRILTDALIIDLGFLVIGALVIWAGTGGRRELGRSFDVACVCVVPLILVDLVGTVIITALDIHVPREVMIALSIVAYLWTAVWIVLAVLELRSEAAADQSTRLAQRAGWAIGVIVLAGVAVQGIWLVNHLENVRPMTQGQAAPDFTLPSMIDGSRFSLASTKGQVTVLDFWAPWCQPCIRSLPHLEALHRKYPEVNVVTINIDAEETEMALEEFKERGYTMRLLQGDRETSSRYGVDAIPHTVIINKSGTVERVLRGGHNDFESVVKPLLK